jgi:hypothetical protein
MKMTEWFFNRTVTDRYGQQVELPIDSNYSPNILSTGYMTHNRILAAKAKPIDLSYSRPVTIAKDCIITDGILRLGNKYMVEDSLCGLHAARGVEIYTLLKSRVRKHFDTCEYNPEDAAKLASWYKDVSKGYRAVKWEVICSDIIDYLQVTKRKYGYIDVDGFRSLSYEYIKLLIMGLLNAASQTCIFSVWHTPRNKCGGDKTIDNKFRPYLKRELAKNFIVLDEDSRKYWQAQSEDCKGHPMRVEIFALERKDTWVTTEQSAA